MPGAATYFYIKQVTALIDTPHIKKPLQSDDYRGSDLKPGS